MKMGEFSSRLREPGKVRGERDARQLFLEIRLETLAILRRMQDTVDVVENIGLIELDTAILLIALRKRMRIDLKEDLKGLIRNSVVARIGLLGMGRTVAE